MEKVIPFIKKDQKSNIAPINGTIKEEVDVVSENIVDKETTLSPIETKTTINIKEKNMAFSFSSIGHALATGIHDFYTGIIAVEGFVAKINTPANQATVEALTALIPVVGPQAVTVERGVFAVAGEVAAILTNVTNGGEQALLNAGFDQTIINDFKSLVSSIPGLFPTTAAPVSATVAIPATTVA